MLTFDGNTQRTCGKGVAQQSDFKKAEEFNGQFTDVFNKNEHTQVPLDRSASFMIDIAVSKDGVIKLLKGLNPSKALGPDELRKGASNKVRSGFCSSFLAIN